MSSNSVSEQLSKREELKKHLYEKLMPDLSGKTQKAIEEAFLETFGKPFVAYLRCKEPSAKCFTCQCINDCRALNK